MIEYPGICYIFMRNMCVWFEIEQPAILIIVINLEITNNQPRGIIVHACLVFFFVKHGVILTNSLSHSKVPVPKE